MTQEEKQLLLIDLCARLPYDVKGRVYAETTDGKYDMDGEMIFFNSPFDVTLDDINTSTEELHVVAIGNEDTVDFIEDQQTLGEPYTIDEFKPYLRPLSSMTEEEFLALQDMCMYKNLEYESIINKFYTLWKRKKDIPFYMYDSNQIDYLTSHYLDYRGLIPMGLALEAPDGMYK